MTKLPCRDCITLPICKSRCIGREPYMLLFVKLNKCSVFSNWYNCIYDPEKEEILRDFFNTKFTIRY